jgi:hypothetical protein
MSSMTAERRRVHPGVDQLALRAFVLLGAITAVVAAQLAGARPDAWQQALLVVLAIALALRPDSSAGVLLLVLLAYVWSTGSDPQSPLVLVAAAGMLVAHLSALVAAQGPAAMTVDAAQVRRYCWRGLLLWLSAAAVWALGLVVDGLPDGRVVYAAGLVVLLVLAAVATRLLGVRR